MRERPVCFVLHGGPGMDHSDMMPELSPLAQFMQLVYIDDRNCGLSEKKDFHTNSIQQNAQPVEKPGSRLMHEPGFWCMGAKEG